MIFDPALLDGRDGFFNMRYAEVLAACDLGVFPSWYEPWGYTPEESVASSVPTITSDLAGFGLWARSLNKESSELGVSVLQRRHQGDACVKSLEKMISDFVAMPDETLAKLRTAARATATKCDWSSFFPYYIRAYDLALGKALEHGAELREAVSDEAPARARTPARTRQQPLVVLASLVLAALHTPQSPDLGKLRTQPALLP